MRLNNGLDSSRQLTSSLLSITDTVKEKRWMFSEKAERMFVWNTTPWECFSCTAGQLIWAAGWKPFVKVMWGCIVDFPLSRLLSQVLLFLPISCVNSIWSVRGWLRAVRACYEYPRQRRDVGMLGYGGGGGLAALRVCLRKRFYVYSHKAQNALHTMDVIRRVNSGRSIMTAAESMLDVTWGFESDLVLFAFDVLTQEWIFEQVPGHRSFIWVRLKAGKDEGFGLWRKRLWDLRMDLKHAHLVRREQRRMEEMIFINSIHITNMKNTIFYNWTK